MTEKILKFKVNPPSMSGDLGRNSPILGRTTYHISAEQKSTPQVGLGIRAETVLPQAYFLNFSFDETNPPSMSGNRGRNSSVPGHVFFILN